MSTPNLHSSESSDIEPVSPACFEIIEVNDEILEYGIIEKPSFRVIAGKLEAVKKSYKIKLNNKISLTTSQNDFISITIKVPIEFGNYEIPSNINTFGYLSIGTIDSVGSGSLYIEANEGCFSMKLEYMLITSNCGWLSLRYVFGVPLSLTGICNMAYSICFNPIQLIDRSVKCNVQHNSKYYNCDISACSLGGEIYSTETYTLDSPYPIAFSQHYKKPIITRPDM